ncbi:hypothetical protein J3R82DRAFT_8989 [Butyriboletus roseoflavus]|nr:hypothetical protein J3R82DRAFT_8989 [Butyriboletus roseoflavus]
MSSNAMTQQKLDELFPAPSLPPSQLSPQRLPGANLESLAALRDVLKDNHRRYHVFVNYTGFHKYVCHHRTREVTMTLSSHITHRALAIYALGGPATVIRDYYKRDGNIQRPAFESPEPITEENFVGHLGDENFYQGYVNFFSKKISEKGAASTLEEFVFSEKYNFQKGRDANTQPEMLTRMFDGLLHPLIHAGYGVEFGLKGMLVEGLAMTAVHEVYVRGSLTTSLFAPSSTNGVDHITNRLSSFVLDAPASTSTPIVSRTGGIHAFDIVARMLKDDRLNRRAPVDFVKQFKESIAEYSPTIREHAEQWTVDLIQPGEVERKMEELVWLSSLVYGPGGLTPNGHRSNFFLCDALGDIKPLSPFADRLPLSTLPSPSLAWLSLHSFSHGTSIPTVPAPKTLATEMTPTPNPFLPILQSAIAHPIDHLIKIQRAFAHSDTLYGTRPAGYFKGTELEDAELLDGTLFLRAALLTADYTGWVREGQEPQQFSFEEFYE